MSARYPLCLYPIARDRASSQNHGTRANRFDAHLPVIVQPLIEKLAVAGLVPAFGRAQPVGGVTERVFSTEMQNPGIAVIVRHPLPRAFAFHDSINGVLERLGLHLRQCPKHHMSDD